MNRDPGREAPMVDSAIEPIDASAARNRDPEEASAANPESQAERYGTPFLEFVGDHEPDDNPADVFDVHGLIVKGEPGLIVGVPKIGKTMLVEDLVLHVASGRREWCGVPIYHRCRVLLFLREDSESTTRRRLWQLARGAGIDHQELAEHLVIDVKSPLYFDDATHTRKLERQLRDFDICMIDSMSTIHNADENSVERMAPIMNCWRDMSLKTETSIPLIHHFRKSGDGARGATAGSGGILQRARGSSVIGATTRHAVGVEAGSAKHEIVISVESNHEIDTDPFVIKRIFGEDNDGRKWIRHKLVGSMQDARSSHEAALVDPIVLEVIRGAGSEGITATELRRRAIQRIKEHRGRGIRPAVIDGAARRLHEAGSSAAATVDGVSWACPEGPKSRP